LKKNRKIKNNRRLISTQPKTELGFQLRFIY